MRARVCGSNPKPPVFLSLWRRNLIEDGGDKPLDQKSPKGSREREREVIVKVDFVFRSQMS